jgi:hypothetical protein
MQNTNSPDEYENARRMTTAQIRSMDAWPKIEEVIKYAMAQTAEELQIPLSEVELVDDTYRWLIRIQGEDAMEIDPRDLRKFPNN